MIKNFNEYLNNNFWEWFGDSKIVDEQGLPKIMYHATKKDFDEFKLLKRKAIWVSETSDMTHSFIGGSKYIEPKSSIMPLYIKCVKPFDYRDVNMVDDFLTLLINHRYDTHISKEENTIKKISKLVNSYRDDILEGHWKTIEHKIGIDTFRILGYDGVFMNELGAITLAVFNPLNIKSAIGNNGNFSKINPSIVESNKLIYKTHRGEIYEQGDKILKITTDKIEYENALILLNKPSKYFVKYYSVKSLGNKYELLMEKLTMLSDDECDIVDLILNTLGRQDYMLDDEKRYSFIKELKQNPEYYDDYTTYDEIIKMLNILKRIYLEAKYLGIILLDLRCGNLGKNNSGNIVHFDLGAG